MTSALPSSNHDGPPPPQHASPPNKRDLKSWWKGFKIPSKHQDAHGTTPSLCAPPRRLPRRRRSLSSFFHEDVCGGMDTSSRRLSLVLRMQDAHLVEPSPDSPAAASAAARMRRRRACSALDKLSAVLSRPIRKRFRRTGPVGFRDGCASTSRTPAKQVTAESRPQGIFGVPLRQSITYANVAISLIDEHGKSYIYGYVPIVVAKCGVFLKEKGRCPQERIEGETLVIDSG
jgi:GTPase-activating protein SAC7